MGWNMPTFAGIFLIALICTVDNGLLTGLLLPNLPAKDKRILVITIGILLGLSQIVLAVSVDQLMKNVLFQYAAILILGWMCIRTLGMNMARSTINYITVIKLWLFTVFGNIDNMIWLGSELKGDRLWLVVASFAMIPLFVAVSLLLSSQAERQQWILPLGAGMMAWAAAALILNLPKVDTAINNLDDAPKTTFQCLITVLILLIGLAIRRLINYQFRTKG